MSIIGKIFSSGAGELVKNVGGVIDSLHTSKEEKLAAELKIKAFLFLKLKIMESGSTIFSPCLNTGLWEYTPAVSFNLPAYTRFLL